MGPAGDADRAYTVGAQSTVDEALPDSGGQNATAWPSGQHQAQGERAAISREEEEGQGLRSKVVEHALFVLSNLATGDESVISQVMDSGVPALLPSYLAYNSGGCSSYGAVRSLRGSSAIQPVCKPATTRTQSMARMVLTVQPCPRL